MTSQDNEYILDQYGNQYSQDGKTLLRGAHVPHNQVMDGCEIIGPYAFEAHETMETIYIPESVKEIGKFAFSCCYGLHVIRFPKGLTKICTGAFSYCSINSFHFPESLSSIGDEAFGYCKYLEKFTGKYASTDGRFLIQHGVLMSYAPRGAHRAIVPEEAIVIGPSAFSGCPGLQEVILPRTVVSICSWAFSNCEDLRKIYVPSTLKVAARNAIWQCNVSVIEI